MTKEDKAFLTAAAINLYLESLRRGASRVLLTPLDIDTLYELIDIITNPIQATPVIDTARSRQLTDTERETVLTGIEQIEQIPESLRRH